MASVCRRSRSRFLSLGKDFRSKPARLAVDALYSVQTVQPPRIIAKTAEGAAGNGAKPDQTEIRHSLREASQVGDFAVHRRHVVSDTNLGAVLCGTANALRSSLRHTKIISMKREAGKREVCHSTRAPISKGAVSDRDGHVQFRRSKVDRFDVVPGSAARVSFWGVMRIPSEVACADSLPAAALP
jgi:hypothetical protein